MRYLSINTAARWLKDRGVRPFSRTALYLAIAKKELRAMTLAPRVTLIRVSDLEAYATACLERKTAKSA